MLFSVLLSYSVISLQNKFYYLNLEIKVGEFEIYNNKNDPK